MKKNIIIAAIAAASALLLSVSCQKENQPASQDEVNAGAKTFTATIEQSLTKTTITADYKVNWTSTDKISINGKSYTAIPRTDAANADFTADDGEATPDGNNKYKAIYPSTLYATDHFALPATQTYTAGAFNAPMYAESATQSLTFKNICAVLAIKVTSEDIATLKSIKVKSDKKLNGTFTVASTADGYKAEIGSDGTEEVVLSVGETAINLTSGGTTFYIAIPEQEYSYLKIYLSEDGTLYKKAMITKKAAGLGTIECNKIYNIDYETNAVQLYANGPYWSTMNIGATTPTDYGWYFSWGNTTGYVYDATNKWVKASDNTKKLGTDGSFSQPNYDDADVSGNGKNLTVDIPVGAEYDAAYANWGGPWRMPTLTDFSYLVSATAVWDDTNKGYTFGTSPNTIFLPAAGGGHETALGDEGSSGLYWSSSLDTDSSERAYTLRKDALSQNNLFRYYGFPVRPVSD